MKNLIYFRKIYFVVFFIFTNLFFSSCSKMQISKFEVQRPSKITVPREVKKVFIRKDLVNGYNDNLQIKSKLLEKLAHELNSLGRFKARVINNFNENDFDPENETIAIIQGEVISGGEVDRGQFTDLATCTGGITGRLSSAGTAEIYKEEITFDNWKGYVCRKGIFKTNISELAISSAFALAGFEEGVPPKNQVVRTYRYKNLSLFAQTNFSFTVIGKIRNTLAIRSDSASFGRSIIEKDSYRNVKESHIISNSLGTLISITKIPIFPIPSKEIALAKLSNPKNIFYNQNQLPAPNKDDFLPKEKKLIIEKLIKKTLNSFIRTISPYKILIEAEIASGGEADVVSSLQNGDSKKVIEIINAIPPKKRGSQDWYNLGLAYEATAISSEDYENARRYYINALEKNPGEKLYAQGIGRCRSYLAENKKLIKQTQK